ncbi:M55 family metallopeptidase [Crossiella cryophila]|uniref:D-amino peptidase n=1 Tax=Crossiella cryophila TaxID=43355 RepID=A0A7W7FXM7_9PSEU|nr:M55 family metallopeptidase [Crossiella cryophila]MBB4679104.1 D-amino peptidase [Crossiella cryophila]
MRILISADMEGVTGVTWGADVKPGSPGWERFRPVFTGDVNACVAGLMAGGATDILVNEAHSSQRNLLIEELDVRARLLTGRHKPLSMMQGIDSGMDGVVFLGYHAAAGQQGVLAHTYLENSVTGVWLDGVLASEGRLNAALAAEHGVPVLMITGDDRCCADAAEYVPAAERVAVKECVSRYAAICLPPTRSWELITEGARRSMTLAGRTAVAPGPHRIEVEFDAAHLAMAAAVIPTVEQIGVLRVGFDAPDMTEAMKCFKIVTAIAGGATEPDWG